MGEQGTNQKVADTYGGILVLGALPGSPAAELGLRYGDVLLSVNGVRTSAVEHFLEARTLDTKRMRVELVRSGQILVLDLDISRRTTRKSLQEVTEHLSSPQGPPSEPGSVRS
jgi:S1-C subfamily serine protease